MKWRNQMPMVGRILGAMLVTSLVMTSTAMAGEWLVKLGRRTTPGELRQQLQRAGHPITQIEDLRFNGWFLVKTATEGLSPLEGRQVGAHAQAAWVEPNKKFGLKPPRRRRALPDPTPAPHPPDPAFRPMSKRGAALDPMLARQWFLDDTGFSKLGPVQGDPRVVVAVIDTGIDYNHPELNGALWFNPGEAGAKAANGIDDDGNGYVDDFMGWDFADNDNLPYDRVSTAPEGNVGHGTHCAGVIAAARNNGFGGAGVAAGVRIMPLRFIGDDGLGDTANAVRALKYAIDMGAWVISNSWGGSDEEPDPDSAALREVFALANAKGRITVVAAGNDGFNIDANPARSTPASYNFPNQINVAATDQQGNMASFSDWGAKTVHLGAPGVGIVSTVPGGNFMSLDGTSMATPIVAGAVALFWSKNPQANFMSVRSAVLSSVTPTPALQGRTVTGGRLNVQSLMGLSATSLR